MKLDIYSAMTLGDRPIQEDCIMDGTARRQADEFESRREFNADSIMLAVCDGLGGHEKGDEASRYLCKQIQELSHQQITDAAALSTVLSQIQQSTLATLPRNSGTTLAGILVRDHMVMAFNAGDSRVYRILDKELKYISHDHSLVQGMIDKALIPEESAINHPLRNLIEFGFGPIFSEAWPQSSIYFFQEPIEDSATYLICTDGLVNAMTDQRIHGLLMPSAVEAGAMLLKAVKSLSMNDNVSFIIVKITF